MQRWTLKKIPSLLPSCIIQCQHGRNGDKFKVNMWPSVPRCVSQVTIIPSPFIYIFTNYCFECKTIFNSPGIMECHSSQTYIFIYFFFHFAYEINFWSKKKNARPNPRKGTCINTSKAFLIESLDQFVVISLIPLGNVLLCVLFVYWLIYLCWSVPGNMAFFFN